MLSFKAVPFFGQEFWFVTFCLKAQPFYFGSRILTCHASPQSIAVFWSIFSICHALPQVTAVFSQKFRPVMLSFKVLSFFCQEFRPVTLSLKAVPSLVKNFDLSRFPSKHYSFLSRISTCHALPQSTAVFGQIKSYYMWLRDRMEPTRDSCHQDKCKKKKKVEYSSVAA